MTNDGELANRLTHPRYGVEKTYYAVLDGPVDDAGLRRLARGVQLDDGMTAPARVEHVRQTQRGDTSLVITIREGRNRQIRRMAEAIGHRTLRLKRERLGPLTLDGLAPGQWRYLTGAELERLRASVGLFRPAGALNRTPSAVAGRDPRAELCTAVGKHRAAPGKRPPPAFAPQPPARRCGAQSARLRPPRALFLWARQGFGYAAKFFQRAAGKTGFTVNMRN